MTVSMRVMSAGDGYKYLLRTVAAGDGDRSLSTPLTRYYAEEGSPPGRWLGAGVAALGGVIVEGDQVSESQLQLLVGMGRNPVTGDPLGLAYPAYKTVAERVQERTAALDPGLGPASRAEVVAQIEAEEAGPGTRRAVAGYDFTFSIPKSASVLWAVADAGTQALIAEAHHAAVAEVVAFMEREVAVALRRDAVSTIAVRQSLLQRRLGLSTVATMTAAGWSAYEAPDVSSRHAVGFADQAAPALLDDFIERTVPSGRG